MTHICRLIAKNWALRNPTLGNRVRATFTLFNILLKTANIKQRSLCPESVSSPCQLQPRRVMPASGRNACSLHLHSQFEILHVKIKTVKIGNFTLKHKNRFDRRK